MNMKKVLVLIAMAMMAGSSVISIAQEPEKKTDAPADSTKQENCMKADTVQMAVLSLDSCSILAAK